MILTSLAQIVALGLTRAFRFNRVEIDPPPPPHAVSSNYFGATLFIFYIIAALVLTKLALQSLLRDYRIAFQRPPRQGQQHVVGHRMEHKRQRRLRTFSALALLSFAVLSYNMLSFLVSSYLHWHDNTQPLASHGLGSIWKWMTTSTLFLDFAKDLCRNSYAFEWTSEAIAATMLQSFFMGAIGTSSYHHPRKLVSMPVIVQTSFPSTSSQFLYYLLTTFTAYRPRLRHPKPPSLLPYRSNPAHFIRPESLLPRHTPA